MLIPIKKGKTIKETADLVNIDIPTWFPLLSKFSNDEQIIIVLNSDLVNNPVSLLPIEQKANVINHYLGINIKQCEDTIKRCYIKDSPEFLACVEYRSKQPDSKRALYEAVNFQCLNLATQVMCLNMDVTNLDDKETKAFERLQKYMIDAPKIIDGLDKQILGLRTKDEIDLAVGMVVKNKSLLNAK
jgi:hypothetical protein